MYIGVIGDHPDTAEQKVSCYSGFKACFYPSIKPSKAYNQTAYPESSSIFFKRLEIYITEENVENNEILIRTVPGKLHMPMSSKKITKGYLLWATVTLKESTEKNFKINLKPIRLIHNF